MHKAPVQGQADQRAAFVGRERCCNGTKAVCAVLKQSCPDQIQATLCSSAVFADLAVVLTGLTQLLLQQQENQYGACV